MTVLNLYRLCSHGTYPTASCSKGSIPELGYRQMYTCIRCFKNRELRDLIRESGQKGHCDWCGSRNVPILSLHDLGDLFRDVAGIYQPVEGFGGDFISNLLQEDWNIFSRKIEDAPNNLIHMMTVAILKAGLDPRDDVDYPDYSGFFHRRDFLIENHWHSKAEAFILSQGTDSDATERWNKFETKNNREYPDHLEAAFDDLAFFYQPGHTLYRARIHEDRFNEKIKLTQMGAPPPDDTPAGRANRARVPVLYLASDERTALAEVRAWKGAAVAIAQMRLRRQQFPEP